MNTEAQVLFDYLFSLVEIQDGIAEDLANPFGVRCIAEKRSEQLNELRAFVAQY